MDQRQEQRRAGLIAFLVLGGIVLIGFSYLLGLTFGWVTILSIPTHGTKSNGALAQMGLSALGFLVGFGMIVAGIALGFAIHITRFFGFRRTVTHCKIIARYVLNSEHQHASEDDVAVGQSVRYYVKLAAPYRGPMEFECVPDVFFSCGEGMVGEAQFQGRWLGRFTPYIGVVPPFNPKH
ncbi:MAG: hypothetical protein JSS72_02470 [Armatimonadetes bacterium]|nr:hypothetical protein [Armatimonadota bacterium]